MPVLSCLNAQQYRRVRWKNDGGWTTEIAADAADTSSTDYRWRISIAEIEKDGPFSHFTGIDRVLVLLAGDGMKLRIDGRSHTLDQRLQTIAFNGESQVTCQLLGGVTRDFNVMTRRGTLTAEVWARPLVNSIVLFTEPQVFWFVYVLTGSFEASQGGERLLIDTHETLRIDFTNSTSRRIILEGSAELILVKFSAIRP